MDVLDRYILKEFLAYFVLILFGLTALYVGVDFISSFWLNEMVLSRFLLMHFYKTPDVLMQMFPLAVLLSTVLVLALMSRQNEILALSVSGVSRWRVLGAFVPVVALLSAFFFLVFDGFVPESNRRLALIRGGQDPETSSQASEAIASGWFRSGNYIYHVSELDKSNNLATDINIYAVNDENRLQTRVWAPHGSFENGQWRFKNGFQIDYSGAEPYPVVSQFEERLGVAIDPPAEFSGTQQKDNEMRLKDLRQYIRKGKAYGFDSTESRVSYHERIASAFSPLMFVLLAVAFGASPISRTSISEGIGGAFAIVIAYILLAKFSISLGKGAHLHPLVAGWVANIALISVAGFKLRRAK